MKDRQRVGFYYRAMTRNPDLFKGKTVLDVGSGLGILSLFAGIFFSFVVEPLYTYLAFLFFKEIVRITKSQALVFTIAKSKNICKYKFIIEP